MKKYHIFIDGPDGCGKSTVAKKLSFELEYPLLKMENAKIEFKKQTIEQASYIFNTLLCQLKDTNFIVDRGYTSSLVYSKVFKRDTDLSYIEQVHYELNPIIIILTASDEILFNRRPVDAVIKNQDRLFIKREYEKLNEYINCEIIDTTNVPISKVVEKVTESIKKQYDENKIYFRWRN